MQATGDGHLSSGKARSETPKSLIFISAPDGLCDLMQITSLFWTSVSSVYNDNNNS